MPLLQLWRHTLLLLRPRGQRHRQWRVPLSVVRSSRGEQEVLLVRLQLRDAGDHGRTGPTCSTIVRAVVAAR